MTTDETVTRLTRWATGRDDVRAMILTSTRAIPNAVVDAYSDYDVIVVVDEVQSMVDEAGWLADFGEVLITYWDPLRVDAATRSASVGSITYYVDGLKIDFSLWSRQSSAMLTATYPCWHPSFRKPAARCSSRRTVTGSLASEGSG